MKVNWKYDDDNGWIVDEHDKIVAFCSAARGVYDHVARKKEFEFIVTAVNSHAELVNALEKFEKYFSGSSEDVTITIAEDGSTLTDVQQAIRAGLAKARGESHEC